MAPLITDFWGHIQVAWFYIQILVDEILIVVGSYFTSWPILVAEIQLLASLISNWLASPDLWVIPFATGV